MEVRCTYSRFFDVLLVGSRFSNGWPYLNRCASGRSRPSLVYLWKKSTKSTYGPTGENLFDAHRSRGDANVGSTSEDRALLS